MTDITSLFLPLTYSTRLQQLNIVLILICIFTFHVHDFGGANETLRGCQSISTTGFQLGRLDCIQPNRQNRSAIRQSPGGRSTSTTASTSHCSRTRDSRRLKIGVHLPQRLDYTPCEFQLSEATGTSIRMRPSSTASLPTVS